MIISPVDNIEWRMIDQIPTIDDTSLTCELHIIQQQQQYISRQLKELSSQINILSVLITILIAIAGLSAAVIPLVHRYIMQSGQAPAPATEAPEYSAVPQK